MKHLFELTPEEMAMFAFMTFAFVAIIVVLIETGFRIKKSGLIDEPEDVDYDAEIARLRKENAEIVEKIIDMKNRRPGRSFDDFKKLLAEK